MAYYNAHTFHLNVVGPNFAEYHALFGEVYDKLWDWHDTLSEQLRQSGEKYPFTLQALCSTTDIKDDAAKKNDSRQMLESMCTVLDDLLEDGEEIYSTADPALETVIGDYCADIKKLSWKIDATLGK